MNIIDKEKRILDIENKINELGDKQAVRQFKGNLDALKRTEMKKLTAWDRVLLARHPKRPKAKGFIHYLSPDFIEFHGDRLYRDDPSIIGGIGTIGGTVFTIIAQQKGQSTEENIRCNFAMPHPEGYRKSLRLMKQAQKFKRPILTIIDTPGAYPGIGAEERGQGQAIAQNLYEMSQLTVPVISVVIGEGGSGGALAIGFANKILMLENAVFSILSPEGYASILWKDASQAPKAAEAMKLTARDLKEFKIIDRIIKEPVGGGHLDPESTFIETKQAILETYQELKRMNEFEIHFQRNQKVREMGFLQRFNYDNLGGRFDDSHKNFRNR